jgi:hypothetical protein
MKEQIYTLTPTQNKRELIIKDNKIIDTKPYTISEDSLFVLDTFLEKNNKNKDIK